MKKLKRLTKASRKDLEERIKSLRQFEAVMRPLLRAGPSHIYNCGKYRKLCRELGIDTLLTFEAIE